MQDALSGESTRLTDQEAIQTITAYQQEKRRQLLEKNKQEAEAFLEANKTKPGVITLPNGLQYKVLAEGSGESPKPEDIVTAHYRGTMIDGTEFDPSKPDQPLTRAANQVIKGWTEALTRMKPGAKWQLYIPPDLAYGERGSPPRIAPNSALIFDVELLSFKPAPPPTPPPAPQPLTSDIIKVPSLEEMKKGAKIETIKAEDVERLQKEAQKQGQPK
jgi:FKBP-type peptidyl-prolyl cis-trans isomerase FklB